MSDEAMAREFPDGNLNCRLAHGIPGPLALLALALRDGVEVPGQAAAIGSMADWLVEHCAGDRFGLNWPGAVPVAAPRSGAPAAPPRRALARSAWCYGSPGVARSLWLAGDALAQPWLCRMAVEAMDAVYRRLLARGQIDSPTFCHGVAGLLQITLRFAHDTGLAMFEEAARELTDQLLAAYQPERLLGYASVEVAGNRVDRPGLLDGAPGVARVLFAAATDVEPEWDRMFMLA